MVAIVTGAGLGLDQSSLKLLGSQGALGSASFGTNDESVYVNTANGNLVVERTDEILTGIGPTDSLSLAYNSLSSSTGYDANNNWQTNDSRAVYGLSGTVDTSGSYVYRNAGDGSVDTYYWNATDSAYVCTQAGNAANRLTYSSSGNTWTWTDGTDQTVEVYDASNGGRIVSSADANGNTLTYSYTGSLLTKVTTADGEYTQLSYTGSNLTGITAYYYANAAAQASNTFSTQSSTSYTYDSSNRLSTVTTTASTGDTVVTTYGHSGTSDLITSISQTGGAQLTINYTTLSGNNVVSSLVQTDSTGVTSTTSFSYSSGTTSITDNNGNVTQLTYNGSGQLTNVQLPPAQSGATAQSMSYTYNSDGDVLTATDALGNVTTYTYDSNDNLLTAIDPLGNKTSYTYDADNHVLTATSSGATDTMSAGAESLLVANVGDTTTFSPLADVSDASGVTLTVTGVGTASHGTVTIVDSDTAIQYTRTSLGSDSFTYTVTDSLGNVATATVTVADAPTTGSPPVANNFSTTIGGVGSALTFDPRAYASDPNGYALTITAVSSPTYGTATITGGGTGVTYTRTADGADSFTYTVSDGHGQTATATVSVADPFAPVNTPPVAGNISTVAAGVGTSLTFNPLAYTSDVNGYPLTITAVSTPGLGTATIVDSGTEITYHRTSDGADTFTYTVSDGHGRTATGTVSVSDPGAAVGQPPIADNFTIDIPMTVNHTTHVVYGAEQFDPRAYCSDVNNYPLTITAVSTPSSGTATIEDSGTQILYGGAGGTFTYTVSDGHGYTATGTITVADGTTTQVVTANNVSVANPGSGNSVTITPLTGDYNLLGNAMTITSVSTPTDGTVSIIDSGTEIKYTSSGTSADSFTYTINAGGSYNAIGTISILSTTPSQLVTANNISAMNNNVGNVTTITPLATAANFLGYAMTITGVSTPSHGTATIIDSGTEIQYTRSSAGADSFTYTISDGHGGTATATISVASGISAPQVMAPANDSIVVNAIGDTQTFNPLANDTNFLDYGMTITSITTPSHGTASIVDSGTEITYTRTGAGNDSITYTLSDGHGNTATATVSISGASTGVSTGSTNWITARYVYDSHENLNYVVDGDGQITQFIYNSQGQQTSAITYTNNVYNLSGFGASTPLTMSEMSSWVSGISDLSAIQRVDTTYDYRGNVLTETTYSACNTTTGAGLTTSPYTVTTYSYDPHGNLLSKQTSGASNSEVYVYDALGRITSATNLAGGTTTVQYDDSTNTTVTTSPLGLTTTSVYNDVGQLISQSESGANFTTTTETFKYDSLGNLCMVTDGNGNTSYFLYDNTGRKTADIAADGSITEYKYNADNQLVATVSYATKLTSTELSSLVNISGNPTDPAVSTVTPTASSGDVWTWRIYDNDNRLIETINGDGDATVFGYDSFSNLISTTSYANTLSSSTVSGFQTTTPTTLQLPTADPGEDDITRNFYDSEGRLIGSLNADGYLTQTIYNDAGQVTQTVAYATAAASSLRASGTLAQLLTNVGTTSNDIHTYSVYDAEGELRYTLDSALHVTEYDYDDAGHLTTTIGYGGVITAPSSYTVANVQSAIAAASLSTNAANQTSYAVYDATTGNLDYTIDAMGDVTQYKYDTNGDVIKVTQFATNDSVSSLPTQATMDSWASAHGTSQDRITRSVYNVAGQCVYGVDAEGYVRQYGYDADGHVTSQIQYAAQYSVSDGVTQSSLATLIGTPSSSTYVQMAYSYDIDGRLTDSYDGDGFDTHLVYDALGRVASSTAAYGTSAAATTQYTYDNADRVLSVTQAYGQTEAATMSYTYSGLGQVLTMTDPNGNVTAYSYDANNQLVSETQAYGTSNAATTAYVYDAVGRVTSTTDPDGHTTSYTYDTQGDVLTSTDGTGATTTNTYDAFGNLLTSTNALGNTSYYFYDHLSRLALEIDPMGYATATTYTIGSEIASVTHYATAVTGTITAGTPPTITTGSQDATTTFTRNVLGQVTEETDADGNTQSYAYDAFGNDISYTNQLGATTTYTYDKRGLMTSETLPESSIESNGTVEATSVTNTYTYDDRGNRTQMVEASGLTEQRTTNYTYDHLNRLTSSSGDAVEVLASNLNSSSSVTPTTTYVYDKNGNVIETIDPAGAETFTYYDQLNRKTAQVSAVGTLSTLAYDSAGNVVTSTVYGTPVALPSSPGGTAPTGSGASRVTTYTYDQDNRLLTTTVAGVLTGDEVSGVYTMTTGNVTTTNVYDAAGDLVQQTDGRGYSIFTYYDKSGRKIAQVDQDNYLTTWALDQNGNVLTEDRYATALSSTPTVSSNPATLASGLSSADDRITTFTYDKNGNRLTETRDNVVASTVNATSGAMSTATTNATITYTYNGLGEVTSQTQATGDATTYTYDGEGRQIQIQQSPFTNYTAATVETTTSESYDGLNDLTRTSEYDADNSLTPAEVTQYTYGAGGRLATMTNADGFTETYSYDADARVMMVSYNRLHSDGTTSTEADVTEYDAAGREVLQSVATYDSSTSTWSMGDEYQTAYDAYGDVSTRSVNGIVQQSYYYDNAGHLYETNANNGTMQMYLYDAAGNQSLEIDSSGYALSGSYTWASLTLAQAIGILTNSGANAIGATDETSQGLLATITTHDGRGQALETIQPFRQLSVNSSDVYTTATLTTSKAYDAFGEVTQQTDANGNVTNFVYNTLGEVIQQLSPTVNYTSTDGAISTARPTTNDYYDVSGRLVGTEDADGNLTTRTLLADTGYQGATALVLKTFDPDGGVYSNAYDVFGNLRSATVPRTVLNQSGSIVASSVTTTYEYDAMNQLVEQDNPVSATGLPGNTTGSALQLIDYFAYDGLGQRIQSWNSELGSSAKATTDYDSEGRIIKQVDMAGNTTTDTYTWSSSAATAGLSMAGAWVDTTINSTGLTETTTTDYFGRTVAKDDFGGNTTSYTYDLAGRLITQDQSNWNTALHLTYFNTGLMASESMSYTILEHHSDGEGGRTPYVNSYSLLSTFAYDGNGNRLDETLSTTGQVGFGTTSPTTISYENATATYDALNRITSLSDTGYDGTTAISETWEYDLNSNVRHIHATYYTLNASGTASTTQSTVDNWFLYDSMNRFVTTDGEFVGTRGSGTIDRGANGTDITYDGAGDRMTATTTLTGQNTSGYYTFQAQMETYTYTANGYLAQTNVALGAVTTSSSSTYDAPAAASGPGTLQAVYVLDAMGRQTSDSEYNSAGTSVVYSKQTTYDNASNVTSDEVTTVESTGSTTLVQNDTFSYDAYNSTSGLYNGAYMGGNVTNQLTTLTSNGTAQPTTDTETTYLWTDQAIAQEVLYTPNTASPGTVYYTWYGYGWANMEGIAVIRDGTPRTVNVVTNFNNQILASDNTDGPQTRDYFFNGVMEGTVSNDGLGNISYTTSVAQQTTVPGSGYYVDGSSTPTQGAEFDGGYTPINAFNVPSDVQSYTVQQGDTLQSIAQQVWGDANFWYLIANANGLSGNASLQAGQVLTIPPNIANSQNNASTFQVYNPNQAIGNTSPTHAPPPPKHSSGCGVFGEIIEAVIGLVVAIFAPEILPGLGPVLSGAITAVATDAFEQGINLATGLQSKFSWTGLAEAAIGGAVGGALAPGGLFGASGAFSGLGQVGAQIADGITGSIVTQGIGLATGLQKQFSWEGVAEAGAEAGIVGEIEPLVQSQTQNAPLLQDLTADFGSPLPSLPTIGDVLADFDGPVSSINADSQEAASSNGSPFGQTSGTAIAAEQAPQQLTPAQYQADTDTYDQAGDSRSMNADQLGLLYQSLGLDTITFANAPVVPAEAEDLPTIETSSPTVAQIVSSSGGALSPTGQVAADMADQQLAQEMGSPSDQQDSISNDTQLAQILAPEANPPGTYWDLKDALEGTPDPFTGDSNDSILSADLRQANIKQMFNSDLDNGMTATAINSLTSPGAQQPSGTTYSMTLSDGSQTGITFIDRNGDGGVDEAMYRDPQTGTVFVNYGDTTNYWYSGTAYFNGGQVSFGPGWQILGPNTKVLPPPPRYGDPGPG